ncbi:NUDIX domain-containing protein [Pseudonocardia sp. N23]|uniref:NUDIX domain-containing protein n=1 Tax=Pseudonocardia sp. N23 TaxID=1987376 RepID=UPI000C02A1AB|nr:NUDIX domain-containing protein [Pseudonocardia sp. N23]GAY13189.1 putative mutT-like protein [Pseudonocardia sp. N23]
MPSESLSYVVGCAPRTVAGLLRDTAVAAPALARAGHRFAADVRLLAPGDQVTLGVRGVPWLPVRLPAVTVVDEVSPTRIATSLVRGPLRALTHVTTLADATAGTRVTDTLTWRAPLGLLADPLVIRPLLRGVLVARAAGLTSRVAAIAGARVVVATALIDGGRLLAAQRTRPPALAGRWELPGGSVEVGESEADAVVRECREELGADVEPCGRLGTDLPIDAGLLRVHLARLRPGSPPPEPLEHAALRWVGASELASLPWVAADRAVLADLAAALT